MIEQQELGASLEILREQALVQAALVAQLRGQQAAGNPDADGARRFLKAVSLAVAFRERVCRLEGVDSPLAPAQLLDHLANPVSEWLPGGPEEPLLEGDFPSSLADELASNAGADPAAEVEQRVILTVMDNLRGRVDGVEEYSRFRRFLIENPTPLMSEARRISLSAGVELGALYEPIRQGGVEEEPEVLTCPRCRWPLQRVGLKRLRCAAELCRQAGAQYVLREGRFIGPETGEEPTAVPAQGRVQLRYGLWRYTLIPGLAELELAQRLAAVPDVEVQLWPALDLYDLEVRYKGTRWRVDVKDHQFVGRLWSLLKNRIPPERTFIVVPEHRSDQIGVLRRLASDEFPYVFCTLRQFVKLVEREVGQ